MQWMIEKPANIRRISNGVMTAKPMSLPLKRHQGHH